MAAGGGAIAITPLHRWLLAAAFAPRRQAWPDDAAPEAVVAAARAHGLAARIGSRLGPGEAPPEAHAALRAATRRAAGSGILRREAVALLAGAAARAAVPIALLKHAALDDGGFLAAGARDAGDVDLLVPELGVALLLAALRDEGFEPAGEDPQEHHLEPLVHRRVGPVELHLRLPGLRGGASGGKVDATWEHLEAAGALQPARGTAAPVQVPGRQLLIAHLLAHALDQHASRPAVYPLLRLVADLADLAATAEEAAAAAERWARRVDPAAAAAVARLAADLAAGDVVEDEALLAHAIRGVEDAGYREALKLRDLAGGPGGLWRRARRSLLLSDRQIERIYGPPASRWGYLRRRLLRPFDLAGRLARAWSAGRGGR